MEIPHVSSHAWIKGLLADLYTFRDRNHNLQPSLIVMGNCSFFCFSKDHGTRNRIDRSFSYFLGEPGLVTLPTPTPPSMTIPAVSVFHTVAYTRMPFVVSGSSPASFFHCTGNLIFTDLNVMHSRSRRIPWDVISSTDVNFSFPRSIRQAPLQAAAAQEPVV